LLRRHATVHTDVFVIGGGPAGLAAAIAASRKGFSVTLADGAKPPIDKACGEGMMPETLSALRTLGVDLHPSHGYRFRGLRFVQSGAQVSADFPDGQGIGIRRTQLHELLIGTAEKCGVDLLWRTPVAGIESDGVLLNSGKIKTRWIIGADGGQSRVRRWAALDSMATSSRRMASRRHYRVRPWTDRMEIYWGQRVQAYVTPISAEEVCVATLGQTANDADFDYALEVLPNLRERLADAELCGRERGAITAVEALNRVWRKSVALVGDASGGVDAITGEGLRLSFRQAEALADAMQAGDLRRYERAHRQLARRPVWMGKLMLQLARHDAMRSHVLRTLSRNPELFARLLAVHVGRASAQDVVAAGTQLARQFLAN
jgi:menaquinone-9 beta-reductase